MGLSKKNIFNLLLLGIMVLAIPLTVKLARQQQILFSRANEATVAFLTPPDGTTLPDGTSCVISRNNQTVSLCTNLKIKIHAPTGADIRLHPRPKTLPSPQPTASPIITPSPSPTPTPTPTLPPGCHYEDVVCVRAPCPQQLICLSPSPSLQPDLIVDSFNTVGTSLSPGTSPYFDVSIKNIGQATAAVSGGFSVKVILINPIGNNIGNCIGVTNNIEPNNFGTVRVTGCPAFDFAGRYNVTAQVDPDNKISESDETNNTKAITLDVASFSSPSPSPDAVIAGAVPFRVSFDPNFATIAGQGTVNPDTGEVIIDITLPPGAGPKPVYLQFFENGVWVPNPPITTTINKLL